MSHKNDIDKNEKDKDEIDQILLDNGIILLFGDIDSELTKRVIERLKYLYIKQKKIIYLYINTDGGDLSCTNAIIDEINGLANNGFTVNTIAVGCAHSAGAFILSHGKKRFATPNSSIMFHQCSYETSDYHKQNKLYVEFIEKMYNKMMLVVAKRCGKRGKHAQNFIQRINETIWLTSDVALKERIIDGIWDYRHE